MLVCSEKSQFSKLNRLTKSSLPFEDFYEETYQLLPEKFIVTFIAVPSLLSLRIGMLVANG